MEDFMAQLAWPGVQPSPLGGGSEATPEAEEEAEETPDVTFVATPTEDIDYAVDMAAT